MDNLTKSIILTPFNILYKISPKLTLKALFRLKLGYKLDLKNPTTYNEKLQWIKLYDKNPLMPKCCDKYTVREYVESKGCGEILNNLIWEGFNPEDIPFDELPKKCVIKVTHGSTFNIICEDSSKLDRDEVISKCKKWLKAKFLACYGEWFYGLEKPRVIVENFIESDDNEPLKDYKIFCFNGKPGFICVDSDRFTSHKRDFYTLDWELMDGYAVSYGSSGKTVPKPECLDKLFEYSKKLSEDFLHVRVDFYIAGGKIYFGELTFTNGAGFDKMKPESFIRETGDMLDLSKKRDY